MGNDFASTGQSSLGPLHPKPNSKWEERRAVRTVAHHSLDADDCADLLEMLDLDPKTGKLSEKEALAATHKAPSRQVQQPVSRKWDAHKKRWTQK